MKWDRVESSQLELQKLIKRKKKAFAFSKAEMEKGEVYDSLKDTVIVIKEATDSTLNRILKSLNVMYKATDASDLETRDKIMYKKVEIQNELYERGAK